MTQECMRELVREAACPPCRRVTVVEHDCSSRTAKDSCRRKRRAVGSKGQKAWSRRQAFGGRKHGGHRERDLGEHDRRGATIDGVEGSSVRSRAIGILLRARHRDPDSALDGVRREALRRRRTRRRCDDDSGAGLHLANLVLATEPMNATPPPECPHRPRRDQHRVRDSFEHR